LAAQPSDDLSLQLGVLCDYAMISQDGKLSLIGIFDRIGVMQVPVHHPRFFVVAALHGETEVNAVEMELVTPDGRSIMRQQIGIDPEAISAGNGNLLLEVTMLPLEMVGRYEFRLHAGDDVLGMIPLTVAPVNMNQPAPLHIVPNT